MKSKLAPWSRRMLGASMLTLIWAVFAEPVAF
jgi:hypothetical protein